MRPETETETKRDTYPVEEENVELVLDELALSAQQVILDVLRRSVAPGTDDFVLRPFRFWLDRSLKRTRHRADMPLTDLLLDLDFGAGTRSFQLFCSLITHFICILVNLNESRALGALQTLKRLLLMDTNLAVGEWLPI